MIETIWRKDFQNSVEKTARAKGNYQWKQQRMYKDLGHCFVDLRWKAKGYSPDIFSELQREPTQLTKFGA